MSLNIPGWSRAANNVQNVLVIAKALLLGVFGFILLASIMPSPLTFVMGLVMMVTFLAVFWYMVAHWNDGTTR